MKKFAKKLLSLLLVLVTVIPLAACGNKDSGGQEKPGNSESGEKVLNVAITADEGTLSPAYMGSQALGVISSVQESLWDVTGDNEIIYQLCESVEVVSETEQILHLRQGVTFSNGNPFTASDVIFSFKLHNEAGMTGQPRVQTVDIEKTTAIDDYTINLQLLAPTIANWTVLSACYIYDEESYTADGAANSPIGTGAYKVTSYVPGSSISLVKNEDWWNGTPEFDAINVKILGEDSQRVNALETELIDIATITTNDYEYVNSLSNVDALGTYSGNNIAVSFNLGPSAAFYQNVEARRAVCHALNSEAMLEAVFLGHGKEMHAVVPDYCFDFEDRFNDLDDTYSIGYDVNLARELADSSGLIGKTLRIITDGSNTQIRLAEMAQGMLSEAGITAEILNFDNATMVQEMYDGDGNWDLMISPGMAPNRRVGDILLNGVRYRPDMVAPGAFEDNQEYLEKAPLCMSLQDEKELSDMLYDMLGRFESQVLQFALFDVENFIAYNTRLDPASIHFSVTSSCPRYQDLKFN